MNHGFYYSNFYVFIFSLKKFVSLGNTWYFKGDNFLLCMFVFLKWNYCATS